MAEQTSHYGRYFEDFAAGDVHRHWPGKTVRESDNNLFCLLTMNHHPVHLDAHYADAAEHGQILVVGTLVFALVVGMTVKDLSGRAIATVGYDEIRHLQPVHIGDTLHAESTVLATRPSRSKPDRGLVTVKTIGRNQRGEEVLSFTREILIPRRDQRDDRRDGRRDDRRDGPGNG